MDTRHDETEQMRAITVSRLYGSGGGEIAARLAARLGWQLVDHDIVARVARELNVEMEEAEAHDERVEHFIVRLLESMRTIEPGIIGDEPFIASRDASEFQRALQRVVEGAVQTGHVVIVGRGAQMFLQDRRDVLHVRVVAPLEQRIVYVARREGLETEQARSRITLKDRDRTRYLLSLHRRSPDDPLLYDLVLNTAVLDLDSAVDLIYLALERKARRLYLPDDQLGPGAGLARYPSVPLDIHPPASITDEPR